MVVTPNKGPRYILILLELAFQLIGKFMKILSGLLSLVVLGSFTTAFAALPSPNSDPLPTYQETENMDTVITEKVQKKIKENSSLKNEPVSAASHQGTITLQGSVKSKAQEKTAIDSAKSVPGVKEVKSQ